MAELPDPPNPDLAVQIGGSDLSEVFASALRQVTVTTELNVPAACHIELGIEGASTIGWSGVDLEQFALGDSVSLKLGTGALEPVFQGRIYAIEPHFAASSSVTITAYDDLHKLRFGTRSKAYHSLSISQVLSQLAGEAGIMTGSIASSSPVYPTLIQHEESDYAFVMRHRAALDYLLQVRNGKLDFGPMPSQAAAALDLSYGEDFSDLWLRLHVLERGSSVTVRGWDLSAKQALVGTASSGGSAMGGTQDGFARSEAVAGSATVHDRIRVTAVEQAQAVATALRQQDMLGFIEGEGCVVGTPSLQAGVTVSIAGVGPRFSGSYLVSSSEHRYGSDGGYHTRFQVCRSGA